MPAKVLSLSTFLDRFEREGTDIKYTWLIGAGMSVSSGIPLAQEVSQIIFLFEYIMYEKTVRPWDSNDNSKINYAKDLDKYLYWYIEQKNNNYDELCLDIEKSKDFIKSKFDDFTSIDINDPICYQTLFSSILLRNETHLKLISSIVKMSNGVNIAHLCLAAILRDYDKFSDTVFTTNFDDQVLKALLSINHYARIFGDLNSQDIPDINPKYPQIVHLHGRHTGYRLKNTQAQVSFINPDLQVAFKDQLKTTSLIVIGYSGWDDLVMKTLLDWKKDDNLIKGDLIWVAWKSASTISSKIRAFLDDCPDGKVIIVESDQNMEEQRHLDADLFMLSLLDKLNAIDGGLTPYRIEILEEAGKQHNFILNQLKYYKLFDPEYNINQQIEEAFNLLKNGEKNNSMKKYELAKKNAGSFDLPLQFRAISQFKIGLYEYLVDLNDCCEESLLKSEHLWSELKASAGMNKIGIKGEADAYRALGELYIKQNNPENAIKHLRMARRKYEDLKYNIEAGYANVLLADISIRTNNLDSAIGFLSGIKDIFIDDDFGLGIYKKSYGDLKKAQDSYDEAMVYYKEAINHLKLLNSELIIADIYKNCGYIYAIKNDFASSNEFFCIAKNIFEKENFKLGIVNIEQSLGEIQFKQENITGALNHFTSAYNTVLQTGSIHTKGNLLADIIKCDICEPGFVNNIDELVKTANKVTSQIKNEYLKSVLKKYNALKNQLDGI